MVVKTTVAAVSLMLLALLVLPGGVSAAQPRGLVGQLAADECTAERAEIGRKAFRKRYGKKRGMAACVRAHRAEARRAVAVATAACQEELDAFGLEEFLFDWESFAECVQVYAEWELDGGLEDDPAVEDPEEPDPEDPASIS